MKGVVSFNYLLDIPCTSFALDDPNQHVNPDSKFMQSIGFTAWSCCNSGVETEENTQAASQMGTY